LRNARKADFSARFGGEEMAILLSSSTVEGARKCAEKIRQLVEQENYFMTQTGPLKVTISLGVSATDASDPESSETVLKEADEALYTAKKTGKNKVVVYLKGQNTQG